MSEEEADPELLDLLRRQLGIDSRQTDGVISPDTNVLRDAEFIYSNAIDVAVDRHATIAASHLIWAEMQKRSYSRSTWAEHELHPKSKDDATLNFIFTMDLLNFSFWSSLPEDRRWSVFYRGRRWTGYWSLVACLQRALDEGIRITDPSFWAMPSTMEKPPILDTPILSPLATDSTVSSPDGQDSGDLVPSVFTVGATQVSASDAAIVQAVSVMSLEDSCDLEKAEEAAMDTNSATMAQSVEVASIDKSHLTAQVMPHIFRGDGDEMMPMLAERLSILYQAGEVLQSQFQGSVARLLEQADHSAGKLVNLLAHHFDYFRDEAQFDGKKVRFLKRAQIFVADVWAAFDAQGPGRFNDIESITMFAGKSSHDYCVD